MMMTMTMITIIIVSYLFVASKFGLVYLRDLNGFFMSKGKNTDCYLLYVQSATC